VHDLDSRGLLAMAQCNAQHRTSCRPAPRSDGKLDLVLGVADIPTDPSADWKPAGLLAKAAAGRGFRAERSSAWISKSSRNIHRGCAEAGYVCRS
jgi:hypothetical protein